VNALIERSREHLPLEFRILRYSPAPWRAEDSLLIGANMNQMLNTQYDLELKRERVVRHLTAEEIADLYPPTSWRDLPPAQQANPSVDDEPSPTKRSPDSEEDEDNDLNPTKAFSLISAFEGLSCDMCIPRWNNCVVSGAHTASGKPPPANDMHIEHSIPDIWYEAH